ncbi:Platelet-activating factor acetylhydrolase [Cryptotermes secundus]|uniref:1-alkyl-2-acetylglycerophosphocholine esterase n=2 Tax=Cryptotermes secundus TaxID=105785 RepID=A0A2J7RPT4_9NEOP|nr:platelet-activating factor acetylhydrolase isoform X2 [Cryptotermes secundus]PNF42838.1 Platelet-activating factor acetylhydrolase [Cryptotermes secundus]
MWWKSAIPHHLPFSEGPYVPGCADLMTEYSSAGCFIRLYYPTSLSHIKKYSARWIPWLADDMYLEGFSRVLQIWKFVLKFVIWLLAGNCHIPVVWNADVQQEGRRLPVIVFSHGLGTSRFFYSTVCTELASHGFVVAAVEHRDNSASASYYYKSKDTRASATPFWIKFKVIGQGPGHYPARKKQVEKRVQECRRVIDLLEKLNGGISVDNVLGKDFELGQFKDRLNLTNLTMMGHSFGGATALLTLGRDYRFKFGVILDPWMFSLKEELNLPSTVKQPLLFINTETFHIAPNFYAVKKYTDTTSNGCGKRTVFTIRGTTHENQTDTPHLVGYWLNWKMKKLPPIIASRINNLLILDFLQKHIGLDHELDTSFLVTHAQNVVEGTLEWKQ